MNRTKGILAAGTLTGLVLITLLALGFKNVSGQNNTEATAVPNIVVQPVSSPQTDTAGNTANNAAASSDPAYTQQLEQALATMQAREAAYQTQLDAANNTILQLQDQINADRAAQSANSASTTSSRSTFGEHEEHESGFFGGFEHDDD